MQCDKKLVYVKQREACKQVRLTLYFPYKKTDVR